MKNLVSLLTIALLFGFIATFGMALPAEASRDNPAQSSFGEDVDLLGGIFSSILDDPDGQTYLENNCTWECNDGRTGGAEVETEEQCAAACAGACGGPCVAAD